MNDLLRIPVFKTATKKAATQCLLNSPLSSPVGLSRADYKGGSASSPNPHYTCKALCLCITLCNSDCCIVGIYSCYSHILWCNICNICNMRCWVENIIANTHWVQCTWYIIVHWWWLCPTHCNIYIVYYMYIYVYYTLYILYIVVCKHVYHITIAIIGW